MAETIQPRLPAGMRDILPDQMIKRQYVMDTVREVFERFGFEPLQTPSIELSETLLGKYGEDAERLIFKSWYGDTPAGDLSLRYDLSVPLCRVVGMYPDLPRPFKRYQLAPVWRAERPQKGRYREFFQCDVDIVGTKSMLADAEIVAVIYTVLSGLGFQAATIAINNRKILDGIGQYAGVPPSLQPGLYRSIDKLDKLGAQGVRRELLMVGVPEEVQRPIQKAARLAVQGKVALDDLSSDLLKAADEMGIALSAEFVNAVQSPLKAQVEQAIAQNPPSDELQAVTAAIVGELAPYIRRYYGDQTQVIPDDAVNRLLDLLDIKGGTEEILAGLESRLTDYPRAAEGIAELRELFQYLAILDVPETACEISFSMVRGLEYYTGPIFETIVRAPKPLPSITGGGRYDNLIGMFSPVSYPATGTSFGIERIIDAMDEAGMFPASIRPTTASVLVTVFNGEMVAESLRVASALRAAGINATVYYDYNDRLGDQVGYAAIKGIPVLIIAGPDEVKAGKLTLKRMGTTASDSDQINLPVEQAIGQIKTWLEMD